MTSQAPRIQHHAEDTLAKLTQIDMVVRPVTEIDHDRMVRIVIKWARRTEANIVDVGEMCAMLDLDLSATLQRDSLRREETSP
jgi:hypothetical protein